MSNIKSKTYVSLIGVPTDVGAADIGARLGAGAIRIAGLPSAVERVSGLKVIDHGDLVGPSNPNDLPRRGLRHLEEVVLWNNLVFNKVFQDLENGALPIMLGGDHCLAIGSIAAVAKYCHGAQKRLRVLWLDAHADCNVPEISPSGNIHGMPVACLAGVGPKELSYLSGFVPILKPENIKQIGIRSVDSEEKSLIHALGVEVFDMRYIDEMGMKSTMESALAGLDADTHLHVSFDVDFLDPSIAPGVCTTVQGGPSYREAQLCMEMIADAQCLGSLDIVELNPTLDERNRTAKTVVELVESLFGKKTLMRNINK